MTKIRNNKPNINTKEYFEAQYSNPAFWSTGWDSAHERLAQAMELIHKRFPKHLDVGCADGVFTKYYLEKFPDTEGWGVDISQAAVNHAKNVCVGGNFEQGDCYALRFKDAEFDLVHSAEVLEHLEYPEKAIEEMHRILKKGGTLIVTTPNEKADDYEEHLWKWDADGVREMIESRMDKSKLKGFKIVEEHPSFHNGHIMYLVAEKL